MRSVVIVLLDPASDRFPRFLHAAILRRPHFLFLQAAMEPFDVAVALRVMVGRATMRDPQPSERLQEPGRSELRPVGPTIEDKRPTPAKSGSRQVPNSFS